MASESVNVFEERHYTVSELADMWKLSTEFVRQIVRREAGVTEWVRQAPGRRRYRVLRVPQSVAERLYHRALSRAEREPPAIRNPRLGLQRSRRTPMERLREAQRIR